MEPENSGQLDKNMLSSSNAKVNQSRSKQNVNDDSIIIYKPFSSNKLEESYLGISIQKERIYVVQKKVISIFQYYPCTPITQSFQKQKKSLENANNLQYSDFRLPILTKQIILPFQISKFTITDKYICVRSKTKTQIRDSQFQTVYFTHDKELNKIDPKKLENQKKSQNNFQNSQDKSKQGPHKNSKNQTANWSDNYVQQEKIVQQLDYSSRIQNDHYIVWKKIIKWGKLKNSLPKLYSFGFWVQYHHQKMNILTKQKSTTLCKSETIGDHKTLETYLKNNRLNQMPHDKSPIFINQLGYIQNFYIWQRSLNTIQIGIQFNKKNALQSEKKCAQNALYQIASIQLKGIFIQKIFHYNSLNDNQFKELDTVKMFKKARKEDGPQLFLAVGKSNQVKGNVKIIAFQVLPEHKIPNQQENESFNQALNQYIDHFTQLSKQKSKLQHSISNNFLLNELMSQTQKIPSKTLSKQKKQGQTSEISNKSALMIENLVLKDCFDLQNAFYNPDSKILWVGDKNSKIFKIHLMNEFELLNCKVSKSEQSIFKKIVCFKSPSQSSELSGIIYDKYPIYKNKLEKSGQQAKFSLQIGISLQESIENHNKNKQIIKNETNREIQDSNNNQNKETIEVDDNQLQKIGRQVKLRQRQLEKYNQLLNNSNNHRERDSQIEQSNIIVKRYTHTQIQTQQLFSAKQQITYTSAIDMLKQLNFQKVQDVLIRFSNLFVSSITKNINKLKQINTKSKEQIKQKISNDIYDIVGQIFQPQMNTVLSQKLQKQILKSRQFIQKLYSKQLQHFNLLILEQKVKQQNYFKKIVQEQLRSIEIIKQTSLKFLDINKIRQMQKIAYSQIVIQNIKQVGNSIRQLYQKINDVQRKSAEFQRQIFQEIKEIKEIFKLLIQQNQNQKDKNYNQNQDDKNFNASYQQSISSQNSQTSSQSDSDSQIDSSSCCENQKFLQQQIYQSFGPKNNYLGQNFQPINTPQFYSYPPYYQESNNYGAPIHMNRNFNNQYPHSYGSSSFMRQNPPTYVPSYQSPPPTPPPQMNNFKSNYPGYNTQNNIPYQNNSSLYPSSQNYAFQKPGMVQYEQRNFYNHQNSNNFYPNPSPNFNQIKKQELKVANKVLNQKKDKKSKNFKNSSSIKNN